MIKTLLYTFIKGYISMICATAGKMLILWHGGRVAKVMIKMDFSGGRAHVHMPHYVHVCPGCLQRSRSMLMLQLMAFIAYCNNEVNLRIFKFKLPRTKDATAAHGGTACTGSPFQVRVGMR